MNDPATPDISLIVNTFQKPGHLALVLDSIARQEGVDGRFELIVSDDGSTDETPRVGEEFPLECPGCGGDIRPIAFRLLSECETIPGLRTLGNLRLLRTSWPRTRADSEHPDPS
jgi:GT2 family glycosyltransferase